MIFIDILVVWSFVEIWRIWISVIIDVIDICGVVMIWIRVVFVNIFFVIFIVKFLIILVWIFVDFIEISIMFVVRW